MSGYEHNDRDISVAEEDGDLIIINLRNGTISRLNSTGRLIWTNLARSMDEIVEIIHSTYDGDREEIARDVQEYLDKLLQDQLIVQTA